jgi:hypothetical protein
MKKILKITSLLFVCGMFYSSAIAGCKTDKDKKYVDLDKAQKDHLCTSINKICNDDRAKEQKKYDGEYDTCVQNCQTNFDKCKDGNKKCKEEKAKCEA